MDPDQDVVWITTRRIKPGTYEEFRKAWRPSTFPEGMLSAYECISEESNEVVGISTWDSFESRERYRLSEVEAARQRAMAPYVEAESSGLYLGRELEIRKLAGELLADEVGDDARVRLALRLLHHLADEEAEEALLAAAVGGDLARVLLQDPVDDGPSSSVSDTASCAT